MRWSITFYETQTKQSDIFSIFSVICVRPFKQSIHSTVTKKKLAGSITKNITKLSFASVRMCEGKRLSAHNFVDFCLQMTQPPAKCCDVNHRHNVGRPISHAKRYADEISYSRRWLSLRWIIPGLDLPGGWGDSTPPVQKSDPTSKSWTNVLGGCKLTPPGNHPEALFIVDAIGVKYW